MKTHRFLFVLLALFPILLFAQSSLQRSTPEEQGVSSKDVAEYLDATMKLQSTTMHGVMVMRHGRVIGEAWNAPFKSTYNHTLYSASKTFTAVAVGLCVQDSLLRVTDKVGDFLLGPDVDEKSDTLHGLTIEDLLTMRSGLPVKYTTLRKDSSYWVRALLSQPMTSKPGTLFAYDSMDTYLLSAIVQKVTGQTVYDLLNERIFKPMGFTKPAWERSPEGVSCGGWGLYLRLEDMAKFGQLLLNKGQWNDEQLIDAQWIDNMMTRHAENGNGTGYGYQIWMTSREGTVRADGAYGQYIYVIPDKDMVVAMFQNQITGGTYNAGSEEWQALCQLLNNVSSNTVLPKSVDYSDLLKKEKGYHLAYTKGDYSSKKHLSLYSAPLTLQLGGNVLSWETIKLSQTRNKELKMTITTNKGETFSMLCGSNEWITNKIKGQPLVYSDRQFLGQFSGLNGPFYASASYGWFGTTGDDLYVRLHYVNWISGCRLHFHFKGSTVTAIKIRLGYTTKELSIPVLPSR